MKSILGIVLLLSSTTALAHESEPTYDRISLSSSAQAEVSNDTIVANLYAEEEGSRPEQLANIVNRKIRSAVDSLKQHDDIKVQTDSYTTSPIYSKNKIRSWRVRQSLRIESQNMAKVSEMLGQLQQTLALQGMHFAVSPQLREKTEDALITEALSAFDRRAVLVTENLKRRGYRIVNVNISTSDGFRNHRSFARVAMMEADAMAAPAVEAGESTMKVTVNGSIELE